MAAKFAPADKVRIEGGSGTPGEIVSVDGEFAVVKGAMGRELVHISLLTKAA